MYNISLLINIKDSYTSDKWKKEISTGDTIEYLVVADMYSILLLQVSAIISETKTLGWAFLQTVPLPTLKCLVLSGKRKHKNQTILTFLCCLNKWTRWIRRSVCIWNKPPDTHKPAQHLYKRRKISVPWLCTYVLVFVLFLPSQAVSPLLWSSREMQSCRWRRPRQPV